MFDHQAMGPSHLHTKLCDVCSQLDIQRLTHPFHPCRKPLPCSTLPIEQFGTYLPLGSIRDIKRRRFACDLCKLVAEKLDKEPEDLDGECRITESEQFCNFKLGADVKALDPSVTHFHLTQVSVIFDTATANQFQGPSLPWDMKARDARSSHYVLNLQIKVKARTHVDAQHTTVSSQTVEEFLDTTGGRYVGTQVDAQLIRAWLDQCENEHGKGCTNSSVLLPDLDKEPTFVIDVIRSCLVETPSQCRYVALSYVWGIAPVFKHLIENTGSLRKTDSLRSLPIPATIRDAITLVHAIGEHYLWVDSICIIQDDFKMQQVEIGRMAAIYSKALFTIIAAAGGSADSGLPGVQPKSREQMQQILKLADGELLAVIDVRRAQSGIDDTVWAERAWTFQERILSGRILVVSENQIYWSCREVSHSEERALENVLDIDRHDLTFPQRHTADCLSFEPLDPFKYCSTYDDLLGLYRQRRLTYQTDLLHAFDGVSQILAALQNDRFIWGIPESLFSYGISWFFTGHTIRNYVEVPVLRSDGSKEMVPFPSWSWAAWSDEDPNGPCFLHAASRNRGQRVTEFYIVDTDYQLVRIEERPMEVLPGGSVRALWQNQQSHPIPSLSRDPLPCIGHLYFWTSFANVKTLRSTQFVEQKKKQVLYIPFPDPDLELGPDEEIVYRDFIVVAAGTHGMLVLLAVEWKDGIAYRTGEAEAFEADWAKAENREWRLIILG